MNSCKICGNKNRLISKNLGICLKCIRENKEEAIKISMKIHEKTRALFNLPPIHTKEEKGKPCYGCGNNCLIPLNSKGFCGLVKNIDNKIVRLAGTSEKAVLEWYYDPIPTNCVAWWTCAACTGLGYPKYAYTEKGDIGYYNLAVFYGACSFDCLFCQNWHYRKLSDNLKPIFSAEELASKAIEKVSCVCFFGGDPSTQMPHALKTSEIIIENSEKNNRIVKICWETNGNMNEKYANLAAELSLKTGGIMKFDLKFWDETLNIVMTGVSNKQSLKNFENIGRKFYDKREKPPLLTASTLLIPGYIDEIEVKNIAEFIASINQEIPYTLLAFYPQYVLNDLPITSKEMALKCLKIAREAGLKNVKLGNVHLLK